MVISYKEIKEEVNLPLEKKITLQFKKKSRGDKPFGKIELHFQQLIGLVDWVDSIDWTRSIGWIG